MKRCNLDCEFLSEFDLFGKEPELYFKGKSQRTSIFGKILTYFYALLYAAFFIYKIVRMLKKVDISFYETYAFSGIPSIHLNNHLFYGGFAIGGKMDEKLYFPVVYFYEGHKVNGEMVWELPYKMLDLEPCQLDKFAEEYKEIFQDKDLENRYCLKNVEEVTLEGYAHLDSFKYLYVAFFPCVGYNLKGEECYDPSVLEEFFAANSVNFNIEDVELTPEKYDHPSQPLEKDINGPVFKTLYQQIYTYLQIVNVETDKDVIGFEGLSDIETKQFLKYDESWIVAAPSPHTYGFQAGKPICEVTIQLSSKVLTQKRSNTKLIEALGDVGGLMEVAWSLFNIIATVITDILYDKALVNNLFSFDLDRKVVLIKKKRNKNQEYNLDENPQIFNRNIPTTRSPIVGSNIYTDELTINTKNRLQDPLNKISNNDNILVAKQKKKKKRKQRASVASAISNNVMNSQNIEMNELRNQNACNNEENNQDIYKNNTMKSNGKNENEGPGGSENRQIIDKIKMKCYCVYLWFCFARKKKNIENILLDEGMRVVVENLDIINIFKKIHDAELIGETLRKGENLFEMSDTCKQKMQALNKSKNNS